MHHLIDALKHGYQIWLPFKEAPISQFHVLLAGIFGVGVGVASLFMGYKDGNFRWSSALEWTSSRKDSAERLHIVAGLQNLGNNCFLNVILQALASCCYFHPFLQSVIEANNSKATDKDEDLPLIVALVALLGELCILQDERYVLSPRRVMSAIGLYVSSFNLTRQQDAAEALVHLLSSLKEEILECYIPCHGSLTDIFSPDGRISHLKSDGESVWERWQSYLIGPFDGTLGSILRCKSCSVQLSMTFEFFLCLPVSPITNRSGCMMDGCTLEDCLKQFTAAECIENYRCNHCSHVSAAKYLFLNEKANETKIEKLENCIDVDSCDCKSLLLSEGIPWPTVHSCALKQLIIGRCPQIMCIQLQRASATASGELIKQKGHISFPLVLDFFPFTAAAFGLGVSEKDRMMQVPKAKSAFHLNYFQMQMLPQLSRLIGKDVDAEDRIGSFIYSSSGSSIIQNSKGESHSIDGDSGNCVQIPDNAYNQPSLKSKGTDMSLQHYNEFKESPLSKPSKDYRYHLVSVVEHYGRVGSGHYAVYRRMKAFSNDDDKDGGSGDDTKEEARTANAQWFYVSDAEVLSVSEEAVLAAEASLLFYERIELGT